MWRCLKGWEAEKAEARYANGVLTVTVPKAEAAKAKAIDVNIHMSHCVTGVVVKRIVVNALIVTCAFESAATGDSAVRCN